MEKLLDQLEKTLDQIEKALDQLAKTLDLLEKALDLLAKTLDQSEKTLDQLVKTLDQIEKELCQKTKQLCKDSKTLFPIAKRLCRMNGRLSSSNPPTHANRKTTVQLTTTTNTEESPWSTGANPPFVRRHPQGARSRATREAGGAAPCLMPRPRTIFLAPDDFDELLAMADDDHLAQRCNEHVVLELVAAVVRLRARARNLDQDERIQHDVRVVRIDDRRRRA